MEPPPSDAELIRASIDEPERFAEVFERHYETVRRYAQRRVGAQAGEDVASRTFESAFRARHRFDPAFRSARPWLLGIASNLVGKHLREERIRLRALASPDPAPSAAEGQDADDRLDAARLGPALAEALAQLAPGDRDVVLLIAWGELTYDEVAVALAIPLGTVRSRLHRARRRLRELVPPLEGTQGWEDR
jgi:RNA polymerase sigma-70 factor (ECF subfamily)